LELKGLGGIGPTTGYRFKHMQFLLKEGGGGIIHRWVQIPNSEG